MARAKRPLGPFGERLRRAIERSSEVETRADLLRKLGIENTTLRRYETGMRSPTIDLVRKIAQVLAVEVSELVGPATPEFVGPDDTAGWADFVRRGYAQLFLARGATADMLEAVRGETRFKGAPTWKDYVIAMEDRMDKLEGETPEAVRDARATNLELERDLSSFVKPPARSKKDR